MATELDSLKQMSPEAAYFVAFVSSYAIEDIPFTKESLTEIIKLAELSEQTNLILENLSLLGVIQKEEDNG